MFSTFEFVITLIVLLLTILHFVSNIFRDRKPIGCKSIPGPSLHIGTRILMFIQLHFFYTVPEFADYWCTCYGDTVGVWMNGGFTIITCDAEWVQKILSGTNSTNFITRMGNDDGLKEIGMYKKGIIWNNDVSRWLIQKKIFQNGLTSDVRKKAFVVAEESARQEIIRIKTSARDNITSTVDILNVVRHTTLAVTLDVTLGIQLDRERSQYLIDCIIGYFKAWEFFLLKPRFVWPLFPFNFFHHRKAVSKLQEEIRRITSTLNQNATPFLSNLHNNELTTEEIHQCILEMILAGTDTSSVSLYYTILFLIENVNIQNKLLDSWDDSLLEAVLRESMRLMPVGPVIIRKALADCEILGNPIKSKTNIVLNIARLNRHPKWFDDPLIFNPERFQQNKNLIELSAPMGLGPKSCVGQHLAMVEMKAILPELITALKFTNINDTGPLIDSKTKWDIAQQPVVNEVLTAFPRKKIVLIGAHSVGKTTLARLIMNRTKAVLVSETARTVMKQLDINAKIIETDPQKSLEFQAAIIKFQCKREEEQEEKHEFTILDRCSLDALIYARTFCEERWSELLDLPETKKCIERYKSDDNYIIFLIEPHINCLKDDGIRMMPSNYNEWKNFSEKYKVIMKEHEIKYHVLEEVDLEKRFSKVFKTLFEI